MGEPEKGEKPKKIYTVTHEVQVENDPWYDGTELLTNIKKIPPHKPYPRTPMNYDTATGGPC